MNRLFSEISERQDAYVRELSGLLRIPSISPVPGYEKEIRRCAEAVAGLLEQAGCSARIFETVGNPVVYAETPYQSGCRTMLVYGHYDVQPEGDRSAWKFDPYEPEVRDGRLYARGAGDNKGQIYAQIKGYEAYCKRFGRPKVNVKFIVEGEEESGSRGLTSFADAHRELLKADFTLWSDGGYHSSGRPVVLLGLKGITYVHLTAKGPCRPLHSGYSSVAENPVTKLVHLLSAMKDTDGHVLIPGFYDGAVQPGERELACMQSIPDELEAYAKDWGFRDLGNVKDSLTFYKKFMYEPTLNIGCIHAGSVEGSKNIVPDKAEAWIDIRLVPGQSVADMTQKVQAFVRDSGFSGIEVECRGTDPAYTPLDNPFVEPVRKAVEQVWKQKPLVYPGHGGSGPFHVFNLMLGAPCIMVPYADAKQNDHGPNESILVENLVLGAETMAVILDAVSKL